MLYYDIYWQHGVVCTVKFVSLLSDIGLFETVAISLIDDEYCHINYVLVDRRPVQMIQCDDGSF